MSFARFVTWLMAVLLAAGGALIAARYGFDLSKWGDDAFYMLLSAIFFTRSIQDALEDMWARHTGPAGVCAADEEDA